MCIFLVAHFRVNKRYGFVPKRMVRDRGKLKAFLNMLHKNKKDRQFSSREKNLCFTVLVVYIE
jgi:hypothetical protein